MSDFSLTSVLKLNLHWEGLEIGYLGHSVKCQDILFVLSHIKPKKRTRSY